LFLAGDPPANSGRLLDVVGVKTNDSGETQMKMQLFLAAASATLLLASASAYAGPCSDEIASLEKTLSGSDAGMGPTDTTGSSDTMDADTAQADEGSMPKAGEAPGTEATALMNETTEGKATSAQDVVKQNEGQPTAAEAAQDEAQTSEVARSSPSEASTLLEQAKEFDQAGKEEDCMAAIEKAKQELAP
jgi:hypothetical protein